MEETTIATKPRIGFLGLGWIGQSRMEAIHKAQTSDIIALCDYSEEMTSKARETLNGCRSHNSFEEMLDQDLEGVVIATPSAGHFEQSKQALQRGKAVFVQKPLALNSAETNELIELAREKDCLLKVDFSYRHTQAMKKLHEVISSGEIGEVYAARLVFHNAYGPDKAWYYQPEKAGGGCLTDLGIHLIDNLFWLFPQADTKSICSALYHRGRLIDNPKDKQVEDYCETQLQLNNGITASLACSWNLPAGQDCEIEVTYYGSKGGVSFKNINGSFYDFETHLMKGTQQEKLVSPPDNWGGRAAVNWARQLQNGNRFDPACQEYLKVAETLDKIYEPTPRVWH